MERFKYLTIDLESSAGRIALAEEGWLGWELVAVWHAHGYTTGVMKRRIGFFEYLHDATALWWHNYRSHF